MNDIAILGNLGNDPEINTSQAGNEYARVSVATNRRWKDRDGEQQEEVTWHKVTIFGQWNVDTIRQARKGSRVYVRGRMKYDEVQDGKGYWPVLIASLVILAQMPPRKDSGNDQDARRADEQQQQQRQRPASNTNPEDDLPF